MVDWGLDKNHFYYWDKPLYNWDKLHDNWDILSQLFTCKNSQKLSLQGVEGELNVMDLGPRYVDAREISYRVDEKKFADTIQLTGN